MPAVERAAVILDSNRCGRSPVLIRGDSNLHVLGLRINTRATRDAHIRKARRLKLENAEQRCGAGSHDQIQVLRMLKHAAARSQIVDGDRVSVGVVFHEVEGQGTKNPCRLAVDWLDGDAHRIGAGEWTADPCVAPVVDGYCQVHQPVIIVSRRELHAVEPAIDRTHSSLHSQRRRVITPSDNGQACSAGKEYPATGGGQRHLDIHIAVGITNADRVA
ncbi:hypothetical protein HRbin36_01561 [bacterium HR36]|nr:hypothetical protein HRbin36_01561 [bacterium HR36]